MLGDVPGAREHLIRALRLFRTLRSEHGAAEALRMLHGATDLDARPGVAGIGDESAGGAAPFA